MRTIDRAVTMAKETFGSRGVFLVHCITAGEHTVNSKHYTGEAIDGHFKDLSLYEQTLIGWKAGFKGIGFYEWWKHPGVHFDIRKQRHVSTWFSTQQGEYNYDFGEFLERLLMEPEMAYGGDLFRDRGLLNNSDC